MRRTWATAGRRSAGAVPGTTGRSSGSAPQGTIRRVEVDTRHFKGNAPGACSLEAASGSTSGSRSSGAAWRELLPRTPLQPHARHVFEDELRELGDVTHVRLNIFPDGGIARLRLFGRPR